MPPTRRGLLSSGALGLVSLLAGCGIEEALPVQSSAERLAPRQWVPDPAVLEFDGYYPRNYVFDYWRYDEARERGDELPPDVESALTEPDSVVLLADTGLEAESIDTHLRIGGSFASVFQGSFDRTAVGDSLEDAEFERLESHHGFTRYDDDSDTDAEHNYEYAVSADTIIRARSDAEIVETSEVASLEPPIVERVIDTREGERERYAGTNDDVARLTDEVRDLTASTVHVTPEVTSSNPEEGDFEGSVGIGWGPKLHGDRTTFRVAILFTDADAVDRSGVEAFANANGGLDDYDEVRVETDGRIARIQAEIATARFDGFQPGDP